MKSIQEIVDDGEGVTYRYRSYYGGYPLEEREEVWRVDKTHNDYATLYHYGVPLVSWNWPDTQQSWLSEYAQTYELTISDKNGIRAVNRSLA